MLVLTRRAGEEISIPSLGVSIRIVSTQGSRTRIGIDAPPSLEICRAELCGNTVIDPKDEINFELCCRSD
ncbi:MAG: carbon storage regulator CsrA [Planctomycetaceae bacterium]|jgi:carbon storage regulator CsrA